MSDISHNANDSQKLPQRMIVVLGPTAGGKTALGVAMAQAFDGEIINADSMQVYRHLNAGTAKPTPEELAGAPHHLVDVVDPTEPWTVHDWLKAAEEKIAEISARGKRTVIVGGTNLYLKALLEGMFDGPGADDAYRQILEARESDDLFAELKQVDEETANRIFPNDRRRVIRALEVFHLTGQPISTLQKQWEENKDKRYLYDPIMIGLRWPVDLINRRINARIKYMFEPEDGTPGLIEETKYLLENDMLGEQAKQALGTKQVLAYLEGRLTREKAVERVKIETRQFAKSQRTWLKRYRNVHWIDADQYETDEVIALALSHVKSLEKDT